MYINYRKQRTLFPLRFRYFSSSSGECCLLAHLAEVHESLFHGAASVVRPSGVNFFL